MKRLLVLVALLSACAASSAGDAEDRTAAMKRLEAQIERQTREYGQKGPRKRFVGINTREERFDQYMQEWLGAIERIGTTNYPPEARGRLYGDVRLTVSIKSDGSVESAVIDSSSGHEILDQGALRIVKLASPFAPFPPEIRKDTDVLVITRTWRFAPGNSVSGK